MPYINVSTSAKVKDKKKFLEEISTLVSSLTKKEMKASYSELRNSIENVIKTKTADFWEKKLNACHVPAAKVRNLIEALNSDQVKSRRVLQNSLLEKDCGHPSLLPAAAFSLDVASINLV